MIKKSLQVFLFLHKESPTDRYVISKYPKMTNKCYYLSMCTLTNFDKNLWSMKYSKMQKIIESIRQKLKNRILCSSKLISKLSWVELKERWYLIYDAKRQSNCFQECLSGVLKYQRFVRQINKFKNTHNY